MDKETALSLLAGLIELRDRRNIELARRQLLEREITRLQGSIDNMTPDEEN